VIWVGCGKGEDVPNAVAPPTFAADETTLAIPISRKGTAIAVVAADVAAAFGPVLEVVALAGLEVVFVLLIVRLRADEGAAQDAGNEEGGDEGGDVDHFERLFARSRTRWGGTTRKKRN
jgi:hypothetical protein